jgi:hypothetical protein
MLHFLCQPVRFPMCGTHSSTQFITGNENFTVETPLQFSAIGTCMRAGLLSLKLATEPLKSQRLRFYNRLGMRYNLATLA